MNVNVNRTDLQAEASAAAGPGARFEPPVLRKPPGVRPDKKSRYRSALPLWICGLGILGSLVLMYVLHPVDGPERRTVSTKRRAFDNSLHEIGTIEALLESPILSHFQGEISWKADDGKLVEAGEPLVRFETKTVEDDIESREKDLIEKKEALRRAKLSIETTRDKYVHLVRKQEVLLAEAELERKNILEMPALADKIDAELVLKSAELDVKKSQVDYDATKELESKGYASVSTVKQQLLDLVTKKSDRAKAKLIYDLTAMGATEDAKHVAEMAVADAKKRLHIAKFDQDADMKASLAGLELAEIDLANFERQIATQRQLLDWGTVRAPMRGNLVFNDVFKGSSKSRSPIQVGETRNTGQDLCTLCDTSNFRIRLWINESDIGDVAVNQRATVSLPALPGKTFKAVVTKLGVVAEDKNIALSSLALRRSGEAFVNVVQARLEFVGLTDEDRKAIRIGFTADVHLQTSEKTQTLLLPWTGVGYDEKGEPYADVVPGPEQTERRKLKLGRGESAAVEILDGLSENEKVLDRTNF